MNFSLEKPARRIRLALTVHYRKNYGRESLEGVLRNISLSGAFLETQTRKFEVGERLKLTLTVADRVRKLNAKVIWTAENGSGVQFDHFNNQDRQLVDDLMYFAETQRDVERSVFATIVDQVDDLNTDPTKKAA